MWVKVVVCWWWYREGPVELQILPSELLIVYQLSPSPFSQMSCCYHHLAPYTYLFPPALEQRNEPLRQEVRTPSHELESIARIVCYTARKTFQRLPCSISLGGCSPQARIACNVNQSGDWSSINSERRLYSTRNGPSGQGKSRSSPLELVPAFASVAGAPRSLVQP